MDGEKKKHAHTQPHPHISTHPYVCLHKNLYIYLCLLTIVEYILSLLQTEAKSSLPNLWELIL